MFFSRFESHDILLDGNLVTVHGSKNEKVIQLKDPSHVFLMNSENIIIVQKDRIRVILSSPDSGHPTTYSPNYMQDCMKHLITELRASTLLIQPEHSVCEVPPLITREFLLWSIGKGYLMELYGNTLIVTR